MDIYGNIMQTACTLAGEDVSAGYPRTVTGALDALADALAGSDVDAGHTIAEAVAAVGENIGGGGPDSVPLYMQYPNGYGDPVVSATWSDGVNIGDARAGNGTSGSQAYQFFAGPVGSVIEIVFQPGWSVDEWMYRDEHGEYSNMAFPAVLTSVNSNKHFKYVQMALLGQPEHMPSMVAFKSNS